MGKQQPASAFILKCFKKCKTIFEMSNVQEKFIFIAVIAKCQKTRLGPCIKQSVGSKVAIAAYSGCFYSKHIQLLINGHSDLETKYYLKT